MNMRTVVFYAVLFVILLVVVSGWALANRPQPSRPDPWVVVEMDTGKLVELRGVTVGDARCVVAANADGVAVWCER